MEKESNGDRARQTHGGNTHAEAPSCPSGRFGTVWIWMVRVPVIIVLLVALYLGVVDYVEFLTGDFADWLSNR
ncbi:MAG: hypothetical protein R6U52_00865 [Kosmotogaceae bacterium]